MKELSTEEKAARYDKAIEIAKSNYDAIVQMDNDCTFAKEGIVNTFHHMFPELKESEDERIRKWLTDTIKSVPNDSIEWDVIDKSDVLDWLEKQGEQKPAIEIKSAEESLGIDSETYNKIVDECIYSEQKPFDYKNASIRQKNFASKVEPKFKVGDWIIYDRHISKVKDMDSEGYLVEDTYGDEGVPPKEFTEKHYRLWTIKDAKDGDVLINWNNTAFIFKAIEDETVKFYIAYNEKWDAIKTPSTKLSHLGLPEPQFGFHPATKEQREQLEKAMTDAGYTFDSEKKELKKIEQKSWSEENKEHVNSLLKRLEGLCRKEFVTTRFAINEDEDWLKSLRPQNRWKPSDEQMKALDRAQAELCNTEYNKPICDLIDSLKKLKE